MTVKSLLMDEDGIRRALRRITHEIIERNRGTSDLVLLGILRRGVPLARRISENIRLVEGADVPVGQLDITLYRDDLVEVSEKPVVRETALPFDVCFVFTARQLIGGSSAGTAANKLSADAAWIFDGLSADDMKKGADGRYGAGCGLGQGAAIPYMDRGTIFDREFTAFLCRSAEKYGIPCQPYRFAAPRSDAGPVNRSGEGVRCALIGWPVRNRTTASEVVRTGDLEAVRELAYRAVTELAAR